MNEFLLSDESLNAHGFIIKTEGIDLSRFLVNPVMFYNHEREKGIIGRWENVHIADNKLYGTPIFDEAHELGKHVSRQVKDGFLKGASIGVEILRRDGEVVLECILKEVSICDIPANKNTVQLYLADRLIDYEQYAERRTDKETAAYFDLLRVKHALGLPDDADINMVIKAIEDILTLQPQSTKNELKMALDRGAITQSEYNAALSLSDNPIKLAQYIAGRNREYEKDFEKKYYAFMRSCKEANWVKSWPRHIELAKSNFIRFKCFIEGLRPYYSISSLINKDTPNAKNRSDWTLDDYRKNDPAALRRDPQLYKRLLNEQQQ